MAIPREELEKIRDYVWGRPDSGKIQNVLDPKQSHPAVDFLRGTRKDAYYAHHHANRANERAARLEDAHAALETRVAAMEGMLRQILTAVTPPAEG